jgi:hypothetical protein
MTQQHSLGNVDKVHINFLGDEFNSAIIGKSVTEEGTQLNKNMGRKSLIDSDNFFDTLFNLLGPLSTEINVHVAHGNHSGGLSFTVLHYISRLYSNIKFHLNYDDIEQHYYDCYKVRSLGVMATHGDKGKKRWKDTFEQLAFDIYGTCKNKIIISGHLHHSKVSEEGSVITHQIGTNSAKCNWERKNMWITSKPKRNWQIFKVSDDQVDEIIYF